jgi:hypothetical protein
VNPGYRGQVTGDSWKGDGKVCPGKEVVSSFHLACAIFPTVMLVFHGEDVVFMGAKVHFLGFNLLS